MSVSRSYNWKREKMSEGFTLIELLVAMLILLLVMGGMVAVSVAGLRSYQKSRATKLVFEDVGYAMNSIAKDVRMGKVESANVPVGSSTPNDELIITRNVDRMKICYKITSTSLGVCDEACGAESCKNIVNLSGTGMVFDMDTSGFRNMATSGDSVAPPNKVRGWAQINLNIGNPSMETDAIRLQTTVSSRDYGWEETQ